MACSKYQYVKKFQRHQQLLPETYIVVRIDGKGFTKFCQKHKMQKPNDIRCINLMNCSAQFVMQQFQDIFLAYGQSDQYSFAFRKDTELFNRRSEKISTCVTSAFTSCFVFSWSKYFDSEMKQIPIFDGRCVVYPNVETLSDYFRWRQADCHINNLYNTTFWCMVKSGKTNTEVENILKDTNSGVKNQILFSEFGINYNNIEQVYRKGSVIAYFQKRDKKEKKSKEATKKKQQEKQEQQQECVREEKEQLQEKHEKEHEQTQIDQQPKYSQTPTTEISSQTVEESTTTKPPHPNHPPKPTKIRYELQIQHIDLISKDFWATIKID